jgi:hypothetical protein
MAALAIRLLGCIPFQKLTFMPAGFDQWLEPFAIWANVFVLVAIVLKISKFKLLGVRSMTQTTGKSLITVAEFVIRDIRIQFFFVAFVYIGYAMLA